MKYTRPKKSIMLYSFTLPVFILAGIFLLGIFLTNYQAFPGQYKGEVLSKKSTSPGSGSTKGNSDAAKNKNTVQVNKPVVNPGQGNMNKNKNMVGVTPEVFTTVQDLDEELGDSQEETDEIIDNIANTPKWQNVLFGTEFKNLGQLRSQFVRNQNTIRKINQEMVKNDGSGDQLMLQERLHLANIEQERIREVLNMSDSQFSILGWVFKIFGLDNSTSVDTDTDTDTDGTGDEIINDGTGSETGEDGTTDTVETDGTVSGARTDDNSWMDY